MDKIIFATGNEHKMTEIRAILSDLGVEILSQKEAGIKADVIEDGMTFEENAMIKATEIAKIAHEMPEYAHAVVLADDSGLEIDYLNKEPGIYSARYAGTNTSYDIKNSLLLSRMKGVPDKQRTAGLSVRWRQYSRTGTKRLSVERWKDVLVTKSPEQMDLATIRSFSCRNMVVPRQSLHRKRRMNSATEEKRFG